MAAMSVVREMHKRLEGNGAEFENKDLAGWMHALRFVLTPRPDLVASATAAGGGSLEAFVVEHLLDLCGATVAPPEFDSAPAAYIVGINVELSSRAFRRELARGLPWRAGRPGLAGGKACRSSYRRVSL